MIIVFFFNEHNNNVNSYNYFTDTTKAFKWNQRVNNY